jgi:hypothetical protein
MYVVFILRNVKGLIFFCQFSLTTMILMIDVEVSIL